MSADFRSVALHGEREGASRAERGPPRYKTAADGSERSGAFEAPRSGEENPRVRGRDQAMHCAVLPTVLSGATLRIVCLEGTVDSTADLRQCEEWHLALLARISHRVSSRGRRGAVPSGVFDPRGAERVLAVRRAPRGEKRPLGAVHRRAQQEAGEIRGLGWTRFSQYSVAPTSPSTMCVHLRGARWPRVPGRAPVSTARCHLSRTEN